MDLYLDRKIATPIIVFRVGDGRITLAARNSNSSNWTAEVFRTDYLLDRFLRQRAGDGLVVVGCVGRDMEPQAIPAGTIPVRLVPLSEEERAIVMPRLLMHGVDFTFWEG